MRQAPFQEIYDALYGHFGPQHWWPGRTRLDVCVGAVLTQNTSWINVEKGIARLRKEGALNLSVLHETPMSVLAEWLYPVRYHNLKADRLKCFVEMVVREYDADLGRLFAQPVAPLREALLSVRGVGPETADCMILYAATQPVFVVDAYTRRFLARHGWVRQGASYDEVAALFTDVLPEDAVLFNEYHALIVALAKKFCRSKPLCRGCPLEGLLPDGGPLTPGARV